jgi:hypothetical protein
MTDQEAHGQAFENGRKKGDAEGYARGKAEAFAEAGDLISRKALLEKQYNASRFNDPSMAEMVVDVRDIKDAPAVTARPVKRGHWIRRGNEMKCSNPKCQFIYYSNNDDFSYCPNCGADMRGEGDA